MVKLFRANLLFAFFISFIVQAQAASETTQKILNERVQKQYNVGIIVAIITPQGTDYFEAGRTSKDTNAPLINQETIFPIASITKVFTTLALANQVIQGRAKLNSEAQAFMPKAVVLPQWRGQAIRLVDLATYTAGMPEAAPLNPGLTVLDNNPYSKVTTEDFAQFLNHYQLPYRPGSHYIYSNLSIALLGLAIEQITGEKFRTYLDNVIFKPLDMHSTFFEVPAEKKPQLVTGYNPVDHPVSSWQFKDMAPAGGLYSTAQDLVQFLKANMAIRSTPLYPAMRLSQQPIRPQGKQSLEEMVDVSHELMSGLGWNVDLSNQLIWKNGNYAGFSSFIGFNKDHSLGVVVLTNTSNIVYTDNIGFHILSPNVSLLPLHQQISLDKSIIKKYSGKYCFNKQEGYVFRQEDDHLITTHFTSKKEPHQSFNIYPMDARQFFGRVDNSIFEFETSKNNKPTRMKLTENNRQQTAMKCDSH